MTPAAQASLQAANAKKFAPREQSVSDPFAVTDQTGKPAADSGWSRVIAKQNAGDGAVASGGPFEPHPSSFGSHL